MYQAIRKKVSLLLAAVMMVSLLLIVPTADVSAQEQMGADPIVLQPEREIDNLESLPAGAAKRDDSITQSNYGFPKYYWLTNFGQRLTDTLEWNIQSDLEEAADYYVWMRICATQGTEFELTVSQNGEIFDTITFKHLDDGYTYTRAAWGYDEAGVISIPSGVSTLSFRMKADQTQSCQIYGLDMIRNSDKPAYEERISEYRQSGAETLDRLRNQDYGYFFQYGVWGYPEHGDKKDMETATNDFDVDSFVQFLKDTGAKSVIWSITWWEYKMQMNVQAVDEIMGNSDFTTERNLIPEIADACKAEGIDFYLYYHQGLQQQPEWKEKQDFPTEYPQTGTGDRTTFFENWKKVISEIGTTLGENLDGWFFDDASVYYGAPFESLAQAAKTGNPARLIAYNGWTGPKVTEFADMAFNEGQWGDLSSQPDSVVKDGILQNGKEKGQLYIGMPIATNNNWGVYNPEEKIELSVTPEYMIERVKATHAQKVPMLINLSMWEDGTLGESVIDGLMQLKAAMSGEEIDMGEIINDTDERITYSPEEDWTVVDDPNNVFIGSTYHRNKNITGTPTVEMTFAGVGFDVYGAQANWSANCDVYVDDELVGSGDFTRIDNDWSYQHVGFSKHDLEYGEHTVKLIYKNSGDKVSEIAFDAFKVYKEPLPEKPVYQVSKVSVSASGSEAALRNEFQLYATVRPQYATDKEVEWSVTDEAGNPTTLAEIDQNGLLKTFNRTGKVVVKAVAKENPEIYGEKIIEIKEIPTLEKIPGLDDRVVREGDWTTRPSTKRIDTTKGGCKAALTFEGNCVEWYGVLSPQHGIANVYIDGELAETVDCYDPTRTEGALLFRSESLESGTHTITIETTGTCNPEGTNTFIEVYHFNVEAESPKAVDVQSLQETYDYALTLSTDGVSEDLKEKLENAMANAKAILDNAKAEQEEVDAASSELEDAISALEGNQNAKTELKSAVEQAEKMVAEKEKYVDTYWKELETALEHAKAVLEDKNATAEEIAEAVKGLQDAMAKQQLKEDNNGNGTGDSGDKDNNTPGTGNAYDKDNPVPDTGDYADIGQYLLLAVISVTILAGCAGCLNSKRKKE